MSYIAAEDVAKAKEMEKYITDERTGLKYELVGDYYLVVGDAETQMKPLESVGFGKPVLIGN